MQDCLISPNARIGKNVEIGYGSRIYDGVEIGDGSVVGDHCSIGLPVGNSENPTRIGPGSVIRSHAAIYRDVELGPKFECGHHILIRDGVQAGVNLRLGSHSSLEGNCTIGDYCRIHGYVQVARDARIGHFVWLFSLTLLTADPLPPSHAETGPTIEDGVVVCVSSTVLPGAVLRKGCFICAGSCARGEVPPGGVVDGHRGELIAHVTQLTNRKLGIAHPWMGHFADAYPEEAQHRIRALHQDILAEIEIYEQFRARRTTRTAG
jgi:UDP-3-O-[3-hydroxymyristoyl] glucosamine N-acyltransferase